MDLMEYRRRIIASSPHLSHAEGAVASFPDGTDLPLKSLLVDIEPVQSGSGDPSPTNVRPISGWDAVKVAFGVNKLPPMVDGTYTGNGLTAVVKDGVATLSGTSTASGNALIIPLAEEYTVTEGYLHLCNSVANASFAPALEDANAMSASSVSWSCSPVNRVAANPSNKIGQKWNRVRVWISSGVTISGTYSPMVCADNTVRPYEPYNGTSLTVQLGRTVYGGTLNPLTGVLTVDRQFFELDGNSNVTKGSSGSTSASEAFPYWATIYIPCNNATTNYSTWRFSHGKCQSAAYSGIFRTFKTNNTTIQITVGTDALLSTTADAKTWLQAQKDNGTPLQIVAELTTPLTYQLSPQTFRSLAGQNNIFADTGNVALDYWAHH